MFVTAEILKAKGACGAGVKYIERFYPNGAELVEIINDRHIPKEFLHWGRQYLTVTEDELKTYCTACKIVNSEGYWYSQDVRDSKYVVQSKNIKSSSFVYNSTDVETSMDVFAGEEVQDSSQIFNSEWVSSSHKIYLSKNIEDSNNICDSSLVNHSLNVLSSTDVLKSREIIKSKNITSSMSVANCIDLKDCLFCFGISNNQFCIFNKPIDEERFEIYKNQYNKLMLNQELPFIKDWPKEMARGYSPTLDLNMSHYYKELSGKFWKWVKTLPNFDEQVLYSITMNPNILLK